MPLLEVATAAEQQVAAGVVEAERQRVDELLNTRGAGRPFPLSVEYSSTASVE
ncbi:MAG TPA: hypothetical protein VF979_07900 [Streptosporangiaceae bacterium]